MKIDLVHGKAQGTMALCGPFISEMLYKIDEQLGVISGFMTIQAGDILFTGSPAGSAAEYAGCWRKPGDRIHAEIEQVGTRCRHARAGSVKGTTMSDVPSLPPLQGIHHIKIAVSDLHRALLFYETLFGAKRIPQVDHIHEGGGSLYAFILEVPNLGSTLELRLNPEQAKKHFPDGNRLRLYTLETHGPDIKPDENDPWLQN